MHAVLVPSPVPTVQFISWAKKADGTMEIFSSSNSHVTLSYSVWWRENENKTCVSDLNTGNWMCKTLWCLPSCTSRGETSDTRLLDMIFLPALRISVGRERTLFLKRVRCKYYNHVNALQILTNTTVHLHSFVNTIYSYSPRHFLSLMLYLIQQYWDGNRDIKHTMACAVEYICDLPGCEDSTINYQQQMFISHFR